MNVLAPVEQKPVQPLQKQALKNEFQYVSKFKSAVYASLLFVLLSHRVAYKVLDLIIKVFTNNLEVIDENENPLILGTLIFAVIIAAVIFIF